MFPLFCHSKNTLLMYPPPSLYSCGFNLHGINDTLFNTLISVLFIHLITKIPLSAFWALALELASIAGETFAKQQIQVTICS